VYEVFKMQVASMNTKSVHLNPRLSRSNPPTTSRCRALRLTTRAEETSVEYPKVSAPPNFKAPEPQALTVTRPKEQALGLTTGAAALAFRLASGAFVLGWKVESLLKDVPEGQYAMKLGPLKVRDVSTVLGDCPRPAEPLVLYEFEASPPCRKVREVAALLDLTVLYKPCPGAKLGFSDEQFAKAGKRTVPYLEDPNTGVAMFESEDQIDYLLKTYGPKPEDFDPKALWPMRGNFAFFTGALAALVRGMKGLKVQENARPDNTQMKPLELWGYEPSPFVRVVREKMESLALPHLMVNTARGSANRDRMVAKTGRFQVPYLVDPNTGIEMFESCEIVEYLEEVYTVK